MLASAAAPWCPPNTAAAERAGMRNTFFTVWLPACNLINFDDFTRAADGRAQAMELSIAARGGGWVGWKEITNLRCFHGFAETTPVSFSAVFAYPSTATFYAPASLPIVPAVRTLLNSLFAAGWTVIALVLVLA